MKLPTTMTKCDFKAVSVLMASYSAFDLADHLADVMPEVLPDGRRLWDMDEMELAVLAFTNYPGGSIGLQLAMEGM